MKVAYVLLALMVAGGVVVGDRYCQAAPAATPTKVSAATEKASERTNVIAASTKAPEPSPTTAAPVKKSTFPVQGKPVTIVNPFPPGGTGDVVARFEAPMLEKEWGVPVQVVNKPGAGGQVALTALVMSNPDGHTIAFATLPASISAYLDQDRKAVFGRNDLQPVALHFVLPMALAVRSDSPYTNLKDLVDAAKARPQQIKMSTTGIMGVAHLGMLLLEKASGAKFAAVHFDGGPPATTALLGGHVDFQIVAISNFTPLVKAGQVRLLGIMDKNESRFFPGVKTFESQGYKGEMATSQGWIVRAGTPTEVVNTLAGTARKIMDTQDYIKKLAELGAEPRYMNAADYSTYWDGLEAVVKQMMAENPQK